MNNTYELLTKEMGISPKIVDLVMEAEGELQEVFRVQDDLTAYNQYKVLSVFQKNRVDASDFNWTTGYGYDDKGRDTLEKVYRDLFHTEAALVRTTFVNGTHAIACAMLACVRPGQTLLSVTGGVYDTLETLVGKRGNVPGSFPDYGIGFREVPLKDGAPDLPAIRAGLCDIRRRSEYGIGTDHRGIETR